MLLILLIYAAFSFLFFSVRSHLDVKTQIYKILLYVCMATLGANSMLLSHQEVTGTSNVWIKVGLTVKGDARFHRTRRFQHPHSVAVFKVLSTSTRKPTRSHLLRPQRHSSSLGWQQHHKGKGGDSSPTPTNIPRVSNCQLIAPNSYVFGFVV